MDKLANSRDIIRRCLDKKPVVLLSGGIDSILTLYLVREQSKDADVLTFAQDFTKEQWAGIERLIFEWDLACYTRPPLNRYLVKSGEHVSLVDEYDAEQIVLPVIRDFEHSDTACALELRPNRTRRFWLDWQTIFTGRLQSDTHPVIGSLVKESVFTRGSLTFASPLFDWTKDEVLAAADTFDLLKYVAAPDTGNVQACVRCLEGAENVFCPKENREISGRQWDGAAMLAAFHAKFGG